MKKGCSCTIFQKKNTADTSRGSRPLQVFGQKIYNASLRHVSNSLGGQRRFPLVSSSSCCCCCIFTKSPWAPASQLHCRGGNKNLQNWTIAVWNIIKEGWGRDGNLNPAFFNVNHSCFCPGWNSFRIPLSLFCFLRMTEFKWLWRRYLNYLADSAPQMSWVICWDCIYRGKNFLCSEFRQVFVSLIFFYINSFIGKITLHSAHSW